jgi:hypothetical protein
MIVTFLITADLVTILCCGVACHSIVAGGFKISSHDRLCHLVLQVLSGVDNQEGIRFIKSLIAGGPLPTNKEEGWLWDIVANKRNGVDVDKFDYLLRDGLATGNAVNLDVQRIMLKSKVEQGQVGSLPGSREGRDSVMLRFPNYITACSDCPLFLVSYSLSLF